MTQQLLSCMCRSLWKTLESMVFSLLYWSHVCNYFFWIKLHGNGDSRLKSNPMGLSPTLGIRTFQHPYSQDQNYIIITCYSQVWKFKMPLQKVVRGGPGWVGGLFPLKHFPPHGINNCCLWTLKIWVSSFASILNQTIPCSSLAHVLICSLRANPYHNLKTDVKKSFHLPSDWRSGSVQF